MTEHKHGMYLYCRKCRRGDLQALANLEGVTLICQHCGEIVAPIRPDNFRALLSMLKDAKCEFCEKGINHERIAG